MFHQSLHLNGFSNAENSEQINQTSAVRVGIRRIIRKVFNGTGIQQEKPAGYFRILDEFVQYRFERISSPPQKKISQTGCWVLSSAKEMLCRGVMIDRTPLACWLIDLIWLLLDFLVAVAVVVPVIAVVARILRSHRITAVEAAIAQHVQAILHTDTHAQQRVKVTVYNSLHTLSKKQTPKRTAANGNI